MMLQLLRGVPHPFPRTQGIIPGFPCVEVPSPQHGYVARGLAQPLRSGPGRGGAGSRQYGLVLDMLCDVPGVVA